MRVIALLFTSALALAACGPGEGGADAGDDAADGGSGGLIVVWNAPGIGQTVDEVTISDLRLKLRDLRVVGDAAPGDEAYVAAAEVELEGGSDKLETDFDRAPPGMYSAFEFAVDRGLDGENSWELNGTVELLGEDIPWRIEDEASRAIDLALVGLDLGASETRKITVQIDLLAVIEGIDWTTVPFDDGRLTIEEGSPLLPTVRTRLVAAFSVDSID